MKSAEKNSPPFELSRRELRFRREGRRACGVFARPTAV
jgi:hypothetical protein